MTSLDTRNHAWSLLGTNLPPGTTSSEEALRLSGLAGWNVRKEPIYTSEGLAIAGKYATVRDVPGEERSEVLGIVGDQFHIVQNEDHIGYLDAFADEVGATFEAAGTTRGAEETFITMKLPSMLRVLGDSDPHDLYVTALNSHVGSKSFTLMVTPVRLVCTNMQSVAIGNAQNVRRVRHTPGVSKIVVDEARQTIDEMFTYLEDFQTTADIMARTPMSEAEFEERIRRGYGTNSTAPHVKARMEVKIDELKQLFAEANTQDGIRNTAWAGYNAIVEFQDHFSETRGGDPYRARALNSVLDTSAKRRALSLMTA